MDTPTFQPSILVRGMMRGDADLGGTEVTCHSYVTDGRIQFLGDCTHKLAGQTVPLVPF